MFTPGTALCSLTYAAIGAVLAALLLAIGFWKTLFIAAFACAGAVLGGIGNKKDAVRDAVNRRFPAKDTPIKETGMNKSDIDEITERIESSLRTEKPAQAEKNEE
ncbi:MAG: DUF2273 domain-containing protein [Clostridia bacterium]|nr:DUF2273 domain-containing protein [Clostridia bacterium]